MNLLTNSAAKAFRSCQRLYQIRYMLGYKAKREAENLYFGTAIHAALEVWWTTKDLEKALAAIKCSDAFTQVKAEELIRGYHCMWSGAELIAMAVESEFAAPLVNPTTKRESQTWRMGGKLDGLVIDSDGLTWILEHKTSSEDIGVGSDYWKRLQMDSQISTYYVGARALGAEPAGCLYDVIKKPSFRPGNVALLDEGGKKIVYNESGERVRTKDGKKWRETGDTALGYVVQSRPEEPEEYRARLREDIAANPERYYQRGNVVRLEDDEKDAAADLWATGRAIREAQLANRWPRNPDACNHWGRTCEFFGVCTRCESLEDPTLFRLAGINEELQTSQPEAAE